MDLDNFFKPPQKGGPSEKETQDFLDSLIKKEELPPSATLADLVKHVREKQSETILGKLTKEMEEGKKLPAYGYDRRKAKGGYVKKYANGGKIRKPTRSY